MQTGAAKAYGGRVTSPMVHIEPRLLDDGLPWGGRRLLGIFAHPDDEMFCAGGTFARYAEHGAEIMVVSATRGQAGQIRDAAVGNRGTIAAVREAELRLACERLGIASRRRRSADVIASTSLTCLVLSPATPTKFAGRGEGARLADGMPVARVNPPAGNLRAGQDMVCCDVSGQVMRKVEALSAYRSQFPLEPDMFPEFLLQEMFGREHFAAASTGRAAQPDEVPPVSVREPERSAPPTAR
jgi:LmbE family N-acetylglucosaminyl deacetylase